MAERSTDATERPVVALLVVAAIVAVVTLGLVLRFGLVQPPALDPVDDATRPGSALAIASYRDGQRGQCLDVVEPDGSVRELLCRMDGGPLVGWDERGILIIRYSSLGERLEVLDPVSGAVLSSGRFDPRVTMPRLWDGTLTVDRVGRTLTVYDEDRTVRWRTEAPDGYRINALARDLQTGAIALLDEAGRLLVLPPGADAPRVWVEDVGARYGEIVWQGTPLTED